MKEQIDEKLLRYKKDIESKKTEESELKGRLKTQLETLNKLGCKSIEEAQKLSKKKREEGEKFDREVEIEMKKFEERYGF